MVIAGVMCGHATYMLLDVFFLVLVGPVETSHGAIVSQKLLDSL